MKRDPEATVDRLMEEIEQLKAAKREAKIGLGAIKIRHKARPYLKYNTRDKPTWIIAKNTLKRIEAALKGTNGKEHK